MTTAPTVREVTQRPDLDTFLKLPWSIYRGDTAWVPPMIADDRDVLAPGGVFFEHADGVILLAERDGKAVGRIVALHDRESSEKDVGVIGFFEAIDDDAVARALFERAEDWLRKKGMKRARGPISPSLLLGAVGILLEGSGRPTIMMPYNPPYYRRMFEGCGYVKGKDLVAYRGMLAEANVADGLERIKQFEKDGLRFRKLEKKKIKEDIKIFLDVHNRAYANSGHYAYTPATPREGDFLAAHFKDVLDPDLFIFVERGDKTIGVCVGMPDASPMMQALDGKLGPIRLVKALLAQRKIRNFRIADFAVDPAEQRKFLGVSVAQLVISNAQKKGYTEAEYSWILEDNTPSRKASEHVGGKVYRTYRVYEKPL